MNVAFAVESLGDRYLPERDEVYVQTEEDSYLLMDKMTDMAGTRSYIEGTYNVIGVPVFEQEEDWYCAPATVKQILHYLNGTSDSQLSYATTLGTDENTGTNMTLIDDLLRDESSENYVYYEIADYDHWISKVIDGIDNGKPAVLDINTVGISAFPYHYAGHYVNTSGYDFRFGSKVRITDPWTDGLGNRWYDADDVYDANMAQWRQAMIW